jgi:RNA polymerase sigma-70 factor (ECF subfamily)
MVMEVTSPIAARVAETDGDLVQRHRYGDPRAFEQVYQRFASMVYNMALRLSGDADEAQDLTQEVFLRVFKSLSRFRGRSSLKTWIYRVSLNHCRSRLGRRRLPMLPLLNRTDREPMPVVDPGRSPEDLALAGDVGRRVARALPRCEPAFREAVVLRDLEGLSYKEIAQVLGVRIGTVRSRIARGREQLRRLLEEEA